MTRLKSIANLCFAAFILTMVLGAQARAAQAPLKLTTEVPDSVNPGKMAWFEAGIENQTMGELTGDLTFRFTLPTGINPVFTLLVQSGSEAPCEMIGQVWQCTAHPSELSQGLGKGFIRGAQLGIRVYAGVAPTASGELPLDVEVASPETGAVLHAHRAMSTEPVGPFRIKAFSAQAFDADEMLVSQAGGSPATLQNGIEIPARVLNEFDVSFPIATQVAPSEIFRDVVVHLPPGLIGNPTSAPRCRSEQLTMPAPDTNVPACPAESQVGLIQLNNHEYASVFNMVPPPGAPAAFGFNFKNVVVPLTARLRPSDYGIDIVTKTSPATIPIHRVDSFFWGLPADPVHDALRSICVRPELGSRGSCPSKAAQRNFLRTPTSCSSGALQWSIEMDSYTHPGVFAKSEGSMPAPTGCDALPFDPKLLLAPDARGTQSPSGLDVDLSVPQSSSPGGLAQADVKRTTVRLPQGVSINPPSADGLQGCSDAQLGLGLEGSAECPDGSKLGTVKISTPLLDHSIGGSVFLRSQASSDPKSGDLYRLAIELRSDADGIDIKLPGSLAADPETGQLTSTFGGLPQLPFESLHLHFKTGPRAPLATPISCGTYRTHAELTSWSGKTVEIDSPFSIDQGCEAAVFKPGFQAGVANSTAGQFSPFSLRVTRDDGMPNISLIDTTLPEGELAKLAGVGVCSDAGAASGNCPASSLLGSATVGAGNGSNPLYLPQAGHSPTAVYLAGPYKGGPYSLVVKVPAQAGPFDLGTVAVRSALHIDPATTRASVASDPLPQIIGGVPVAYRDIRVNVDRPNFTVSPTSCEPKTVTATVASSTGGSADVSDRFQVADCAALGFKPKLALALKGGTTRGKNPALRATLTMPRKNANIDRASVALPHSEFLAQDHIRTVCTRVQFAAAGGGGEKCPPGSIYGKATASSPLLDRPLSGPVYLRSSSHPLPDLVVALDGEIHVDLVGRIDSKGGGIRTTFANVPDAPVSRFVLSMQGGRKGLLENSTNLCATSSRATAKFDGQNGRLSDTAPVLVANCGKKGKRR